MELPEFLAKLLLRRFHVQSHSHFLIDESTSFEKFCGWEGGVVRPQICGESVEQCEKEVKSGADLEQVVKEMLGKKVLVKGRGLDGFLVDKVLFLPKGSERAGISLHVGINERGDVVVSLKDEEKIVSEVVQERKKLFRYQVARLVASIRLSPPLKDSLAKIIDSLVAALFHYDAESIEIDSFTIHEERNLLAYTVRMNVDGNAFFRQKELKELCVHQTERERSVSSPFPYMMGRGSIGCLANGKGLGLYMANNIQKKGGAIAGILDIGEVCREETLCMGIKTLMRDSSVDGVCMNLLSGLTDGEKVVDRILATLRSAAAIRGRFFLRIEGTNTGNIAAKTSDILYVTRSLDEMVEKVVAHHAHSCR